MTRIGRSPARRGLPLVLALTGLTTLLLAVGTARPLGGLPILYLALLGSWLVLLPGAILLYLAWFFRPVAVDLRAGMARLGRTTVPLATVTAARREVSIGPNSGYLSYRFTSTSGAWGRVLVAGRPLRGLDPAGLRLFEQFVAAAPIWDPPVRGGLTPAQRRLVDVLNEHGSKTPVGRDAILAELRGEQAEPVEEQDHPPPEVLRRQWQDDDRAAALVALSPVAGAVRRVAGWLTAAAVGVGMVAVVVAAVMEQSEPSGRLDTQANDRVAAVVLATIAAGLACYLTFCLASYASIRGAQRSVLAWLRGRDAGQLARGLPPRLLQPFLGPPPGNRLRHLAGFACAMVALTGLVAPPVILATEPNLPGELSLGLFLAGLVTATTAILLYRSAGRATLAQHELAVRLGGRRLVSDLEEISQPGPGTAV